MKSEIIILIFGIIVFSFMLTIPTNVNAEHTTCVEDNPELCGSMMDWGDIFDNTEVRGPSLEEIYSGGREFDDSTEEIIDRYQTEIPDEEENTYGNPIYRGFRSLFHGINIAQDEYIRQSVTAQGPYEFTEDSNTFGDGNWLPGDENFRPQYLSTDYYPGWMSILFADNVEEGFVSVEGDEHNTDYGNAAKLRDGVTSAEINTWNNSLFGVEGLGIVEDNWDSESWALHTEENNTKFKPEQVRFNASLPDNTTIKLEFYDPENKPLDNYKPSEEKKLGEVVLDENEEGVVSRSRITELIEPIRHGNNNELGLEEYVVPQKFQGGGLWNTYTNIRTYHMSITVKRNSADDESPLIDVGSPIELREKPIPHRSLHEPWFGYPQTLPTLGQTNERGDRFDILTSGNIGDNTIIGHTQNMLRNYEEDYLEEEILENQKTASSPRVPLKEDDEDLKFEEFYHGAADGFTRYEEKLYHVKSDDLNETDNQIFFHHLNTQTPRIELSSFYQENYSTINKSDWKTVASEEGATYSFVEGAVNDINYSNSNFRRYEHEVKDQPCTAEDPCVKRKYDGFEKNSSELGLPKNSTKGEYKANHENGGDKKNLYTNALKLDYDINEFKINSSIGIWYWLNNTYYKNNYGEDIPVEQEEYRDNKKTFFPFTKRLDQGQESKAYIESYSRENHPIPGNLSKIADETFITERQIKEELNKSEAWDIEGLYSVINDVSVEYNISYSRLIYGQQLCPDHPGLIERVDEPLNIPGAPQINNEYELIFAGENNEPKEDIIVDLDRRPFGRLLVSNIVNDGDPEPENKSNKQINNVYSSYSDYVSSNFDTYRYPNGSADTRGSCETPGKIGPTGEIPSGERGWALDTLEEPYESVPRPKLKTAARNPGSNTTIQDARQAALNTVIRGNVWHDDQFNVTYNITGEYIGDIVGSSPDSTEIKGGPFNYSVDDNTDVVPTIKDSIDHRSRTIDIYDIDTFGSDLIDNDSKRKTEDAIKYQTAYGDSEFSSRTYFDRNTEDYKLNKTRWTRLESSAVSQRQTQVFETSENTTKNIDIASETGLSGTFNDPADLSGIKPLNNTIGEDISVYLDLYYFGPSDGRLTLWVNSSNTNKEKILDGKDLTGPGQGYTEFEKVDNIDITNELDGAKDSFDIIYKLESRNDDASIDNRLDSIVTFETNHPVKSIESRWAYSTFRDASYDMIYEFNDTSCITDSESQCYNYLNHSIPFKRIDGERNTDPLPDPQENNNITTHYPSNSMFSHPYLVPTSRSIEIQYPPNDLGLIHVNPVDPFTEYIDEKIAGNTRNYIDESNLDLKSEGDIYLDSVGTSLERKNSDTVAGTPQVFVGIDLYDFYSRSEEERRPDIQNWTYDNFPAMVQYPFTDGSEEGTENFEWNENAFPDNYDSDDVDVHNLWIQDGKVYMNATVPNSEFYGNMYLERLNFLLLDFPRSYINNWREWGDISGSKVEDGLIFGGYEGYNLDEIRRHELEGDDNDGGFFDFRDLDDKIEGAQPPDDNKAKKIVNDATIETTEEAWVLNAQDVEEELNESNAPYALNYMNSSGLSSPRCAYDTYNEVRYCDLTIAEMAGYNVEEAYRQEMTGHMQQFRPPINTDINKTPFVEYSEFELVNEYLRPFESWSVSADASWVTREIDKTDTNLFDSPKVRMRGVKSKNLDELDNLDNDIHKIIEENNDTVQQYKLTVLDSNGVPISFENRIETIPGIDLANTDNRSMREGVCIDVDSGGKNYNGDNKECYSTNQEGELFFAIKSVGDKDADEIDYTVDVVGNVERWWDVPSQYRLLESDSFRYTATALNTPERNTTIPVPPSIIAIIIIILMLLYALSKVLRIFSKPGQGPTTRDLISLMFGPIAIGPVKTFVRYIMYIMIASIGVSVIVSLGSGDISPFFLFEAIISSIWNGILDLLP